MTDSERDEQEYLLRTAEARRQQADSFAWTVPGLAIAGQAFLLSVALASDTEPLGRLLASLAGIVALLASAHLLAKQVYNFDLYEAVIEKERRRLDLPGLQTDALTKDPESYPANTSYAKRKWWSRWRLRHWLVVRTKAVWVWTATLIALALIDGFLVGYSIYAMTCSDSLLG